MSDEIGNKQVNLSLTVDEVSFIVSGLRDCADAARMRLNSEDPHKDAQWYIDNHRMYNENRMLADRLEHEMLEVL